MVQMGDWPTESVASQSYKKRLSELQLGACSAESALRGAELGVVGLNHKLLAKGNSEEGEEERVSVQTLDRNAAPSTTP